MSHKCTFLKGIHYYVLEGMSKTPDSFEILVKSKLFVSPPLSRHDYMAISRLDETKLVNPEDH